MNSIIDLYSKFLIAFVGIVTPALSLFLNTYIIDRRGFSTMMRNREARANQLVNENYDKSKSNPDIDGVAIMEFSYKLLQEQKQQDELWGQVISKLDPTPFFKRNVLLLFGAMLSLFLWLFIRSCKIWAWDSQPYVILQICFALFSVFLCAWHIVKLYKLGLYLLSVREVVADINDEIKEVKQQTQSQPVLRKR